MIRSVRSCVLAVVLLALLTGCTAFPLPPQELSDEVVLRVPAGTADAVAKDLGRRLDVAQITERSISTAGDRVTVHYNPPRRDGKRVAVKHELFDAAGVLGIRPVTRLGTDASVPAECTREASPCAASTDHGEPLVLGPSAVTNKHLRKAEAVQPQGQWGVQLDFTKDGAAALKTLTDKVSCQDDEQLKRIAILVDGRILTAPDLRLECGQSLSDSAEIAGLDRDQSAQLAALLSAPLPAGVTVISSQP
ncbi:SecDF P1 head subdomain-containing protein [Microbacterium sp. 22242]|uniref:SecDF P1 head subdomain-containing protein n=1 Tax=Microbacterium sp. 22242 TaxID=3453896 RepID=UPI003F860004